jgi:hypothetical protein
VALEVDRVGVDGLAREAELEQVVGGNQPGDDRGGAGAEAAGERDLGADRKPQSIRGMQSLERLHAEIRPIGWKVV